MLEHFYLINICYQLYGFEMYINSVLKHKSDDIIVWCVAVAHIAVLWMSLPSRDWWTPEGTYSRASCPTHQWCDLRIWSLRTDNTDPPTVPEQHICQDTKMSNLQLKLIPQRPAFNIHSNIFSQVCKLLLGLSAKWWNMDAWFCSQVWGEGLMLHDGNIL